MSFKFYRLHNAIFYKFEIWITYIIAPDVQYRLYYEL